MHQRAWVLVAAVLLSGCGGVPAPTPPAVPGAPRSASATSLPAGGTSRTGQSDLVEAPPSAPGWATEVVRAGHTAYVVGRSRSHQVALWRIDPQGHLSARTAPPATSVGATSVGAPATRSGVLDLVFDGPRTGFALTGSIGDRTLRSRLVLYATHDGARTWTPVRLATRDRPLLVSAAGGAAYALTGCPDPGADCPRAALWTIDPSGRRAPETFTSLPMRTASGSTALAAYGDQVWVLLGLGAGTGTALRSEDGGRTWHRFPMAPCVTDRPAATSADVLWTTCVTGMLQHFSRQTGGGPPVGVFEGDLSGTSGSSLVPVSDTTAYAVIAGGRGARLDVTHDGGRTTHRVAALPRLLARGDPQVTFVSAAVGYLVGRYSGTLDRTTDGGRTWQPIPSP